MIVGELRGIRITGPTARAQRKEGDQTTSRGFHDDKGEVAGVLVCKQRRQREDDADPTDDFTRHVVAIDVLHTNRSHLSPDGHEQRSHQDQELELRAIPA